jgi:SAM-dependent methyltransferase
MSQARDQTSVDETDLNGNDGMCKWPWRLGSLPFVCAPLSVPTNGNGLPDSLPFALDVDNVTGTLIQAPAEEVRNVVSRAYQKGAIFSGMMDECGIGKEYAEDFLSFLKRSLANRFEGERVLEIGCGTGYLLHRLRLLGADVLGIEPGPQGQEGSKRFQIPIIRDFFPSSRITEKFDIIILFAVMEHAPSSSDFLSSLSKFLSTGGRIVISVPDCEPYMKSGDISILTHEHWNYYTETTLRNSIRKYTGLDVVAERSSFGGVLHTIAHESASVPVTSSVRTDEAIQIAHEFRRLARISVLRFLRYFKEANAKGHSVGVYVPARAINALSIIRDTVDLSKVRFFDDNNVLHGTYFPGFAIPIESQEELISTPTDRVLIMSRSFGQRIADTLRRSIGQPLVITTSNDLFSG